MTTIKASCPICGEQELTPTDIDLQVSGDDPDLSTYAFFCLTCSDTVRKPAPPEIVRLLVSGGVQVHVWFVPAEAQERHDGPPLTWDDLLTLHEALEAHSPGTAGQRPDQHAVPANTG